MTSLRVLFVHGLESGPQGRKVQALRAAGMEVVAEAMPSSQRSMLRAPFTIALLALAALFVLVGFSLGWQGAAVSVLLVVLSAPWLMRVVIRRAFRESVRVQETALRRHSIDVVVGSSYGGAVSLELIRRGAWKGPTLLLCPAHRLVAEWARLPYKPLALGANVSVVHGTNDSTVPIAHSRDLVRGSAARLIEVDGDHRLNDAATPAALAEWIAETHKRAG